MKEITFKALSFLLLLLSFHQSPGQVPSKDTLDLDEVVITATKTAISPGLVTQKIDVLNAAEIEHVISGNRNLAEALEYLPGASVSVLSRNDANWGSYGGIGPKYSTYMLSGLPVDAFIDPQSIEVAALEKIEVQRGPASVLYPNWLSQDFAGNQSPLAGTVNLVLKERISRQETIVSTAYGSYNTFNGQVYHQDHKDRLHYFAGMNYEMSDYTDYGTEGSWLNMQDNPQYRKTKIFAGVNFSLDKEEKHSAALFVNQVFHDGDAGRVYRGFDNRYTTLNAGYSAQLSDRLSLNVSFGMRLYDRTWQESVFHVTDSLVSNNGAYQDIVPADAHLSFRHGKAHQLIIGTDYQAARYHSWSDPLVGYHMYGNKSSALQSGVYAQEELRFNRLILRGGMRYNYIKTDIELVSGGAPGEKSKSWNSLLWNVGIKYHIRSILALFANAGNSFMTPGLKSVGGTILLSDIGLPGKNGQLPNPGLKPESGLGLDAGANLFLPNNIRFSARAFYLAVEDAIVDIVVSEDPSQSQSINAGRSSSRGIELQIGQSLNRVLSWFANYTWMKTNIENPTAEDQDDVEVPFAPEHLANAGLDLSFDFGLKVSPYLNYNGGYYDSNSKSARKKFIPGAVLNTYISQNITQQENIQLTAFLQLYNLTNNRYEMPWQFQNTGFSVMGGLKMTIF